MTYNCLSFSLNYGDKVDFFAISKYDFRVRMGECMHRPGAWVTTCLIALLLLAGAVSPAFARKSGPDVATLEARIADLEKRIEDLETKIMLLRQAAPGLSSSSMAPGSEPAGSFPVAQPPTGQPAVQGTLTHTHSSGLPVV